MVLGFTHMSFLPRAVLFDHDGVLVASEPLHWAAWGKLARELGLPFHEPDVRSQVGKTGPQIIASLLDKYRPGWTRDQYDPNALAHKKNDYYIADVATKLTTYPGVAEGLRWLRENGVRTAVVSNARRRELQAALEGLGLVPLFDTIVSRDEARAAKPDPMPYLVAAATLGCDPAECFAVEDSPPGLEAALMAKIPTAALLTNFPREAVAEPVPGRPDLRPAWIGADAGAFFAWLKTLPRR
jgi:beta-phosphoglucomutase